MIYLPHGLVHTVLNLRDNVAITENYLFLDAIPGSNWNPSLCKINYRFKMNAVLLFFVELVKFLALDEIAVWRPEWSNQVWKKLYFSNLISAKVWSTLTPCLKIAEKVSFNIASEASYVYILSGQKWSILAFLINFFPLKM